jgi:hypothetical protein
LEIDEQQESDGALSTEDDVIALCIIIGETD